jgi:hypothetical protein
MRKDPAPFADTAPLFDVMRTLARGSDVLSTAAAQMP